MEIIATLQSLLGNIIFLSTVTSLFTAQVLKFLVDFFKNKIIKKDINVLETLFWRTGGMPSSHSAVVCAMCASTGIKEGFDSDLFVFSLIFAMVVLRDALGVRRAAGIQAKTLNNLGKQTAEKTGIEFASVKEIQGHTPIEVIVGAILGIVISIIYHTFLYARIF